MKEKTNRDKLIKLMPSTICGKVNINYLKVSEVLPENIFVWLFCN